MNELELEARIRAALYAVAPDLEGQPIDPDARYRDQFEIDSMDFLRFLVELNKVTGVQVAESDYPRLETLAGGVAYLRERLGAVSG